MQQFKVQATALTNLLNPSYKLQTDHFSFPVYFAIASGYN